MLFLYLYILFVLIMVCIIAEEFLLCGVQIWKVVDWLMNFSDNLMVFLNGSIFIFVIIYLKNVEYFRGVVFIYYG